MSEGWAPKGYSAPREYEKNERRVIGFGVLLAIVFGAIAIFPIANSLLAYQQFIDSATTALGVQSLPSSLEFGLVMIALVLLVKFVVIPVHEGLHYGVGKLLNMNPDFGYEEALLMDNPRVVALSTEIPIWKNLAMIIAPFTVIGALSLGIIQVSGGLLSGVAAVVFWINSASSAQDLYHYLRLLRMNPDTLFANFEEDGEIRTEYAVPE